MSFTWLLWQWVHVDVDGLEFRFVCLSFTLIFPFFSREVRLSASKMSGPVNGDECYFWRTTGCYFAEKCRFRHVPESKGVDLKRVEAKYGGKLRVTPPSSD